MENNNEFFIKIGKEIIPLAPTNEEDYKKLINAIINITGVTVANSTRGYKTDKERTEAVLKMCGQLSTDAAKHALVMIANENISTRKGGDA